MSLRRLSSSAVVTIHSRITSLAAIISTPSWLFRMSAGHRRGHPIRAEEKMRAVAMMREPRFRRALHQYGREDNSHRIVFLAGSDNAGRTIFYDKDLPEKLRIRRRDGRVEP